MQKNKNGKINTKFVKNCLYENILQKSLTDAKIVPILFQ